jgi:GT2 family glycosyltransferase
MEASVLIVCYNSRPFIDDCIQSIQKHVRGTTFEILVVNCSPSDGLQDYISTTYPSVRVIPNTENLGFAKGNNLLAAHAAGEYLVLLNPDTILVDDAITILVKSAKKYQNLGAIAGRAVDLNGKRDAGGRLYYPTMFRLLVAAIGGAQFLNGGLPERAVKEGCVETVSGCFMMVPRLVWEKMQGMDESFFAYYEELDLCRRITDSRMQIIMDPRSEIIHIGGSGSKRSDRILLKTRAHAHYLNKHWSGVKLQIGLFLIWFHSLVRWVAGLIIYASRAGTRNELKDCYEGIVTRPQNWWRGFCDATKIGS